MLSDGPSSAPRVASFGGAHIVTVNGDPCAEVGETLRKLVGVGSAGSRGLVVDLRGMTSIDEATGADLLEVGGRMPPACAVIVSETPRMAGDLRAHGLVPTYLVSPSLRGALQLLGIPLSPGVAPA